MDRCGTTGSKSIESAGGGSSTEEKVKLMFHLPVWSSTCAGFFVYFPVVDIEITPIDHIELDSVRDRPLKLKSVWGIRDRCWYCGNHGKTTRDHFYPKSKGGYTRVWACINCQTEKGCLLPKDWINKVKQSSHYSDDMKTRIITATKSLQKNIPIELFPDHELTFKVTRGKALTILTSLKQNKHLTKGEETLINVLMKTWNDNTIKILNEQLTTN